MAEKLKLKSEEIVYLRGVSGSFRPAVVFAVEEHRVSFIVADEGHPAFVQLDWDVDHYVSHNNRKPVQIDRSHWVKAKLKKLATDDGIMELREETCYIGKAYMFDVNSIHDMTWGHTDHPGKEWTRPSAYVFHEPDESDRAAMPVELFEIEAQA